MMNIQRFMCNPLQENCYVVSDESKECVIIDCGAFYQEEKDAIAHYIQENHLKPIHLLATHGHVDHNFGNNYLFNTYGLRVEICNEDQQLVEHLEQQASDILGISVGVPQAETGTLLSDGDTIGFGQYTLKVIKTPGHSHGSAIFYCPEEHVAFTGDTLFRMSIGRTDFKEGSWTEMEHSLHHIATQLPKSTVILPGHGPRSTMADELSYNPYLH